MPRPSPQILPKMPRNHQTRPQALPSLPMQLLLSLLMPHPLQLPRRLLPRRLLLLQQLHLLLQLGATKSCLCADQFLAKW